MRSNELYETEARLDLTEWGEPLIGDCLQNAYLLYCEGNEVKIQPFLRQHLRFWRLLFTRDVKMETARRDLLALANAGRLTQKQIEAADALVLDELLEVVAMRFRRSPPKMRVYNRLLIEAAETLTETRLALAA